MKRYFEVIGERLTLQLEVNKKGMELTTEQISKIYNMKLREVTRKEYNRLCKEYEQLKKEVKLMSIKGLDMNNVVIHEGEEKRQVKYPKIYKHFKHDPEGIPNNYTYVTLFESEPKDTEWLMQQESEQIGIMETEHNWYGSSYLINGKYYHSNKLCSEKMVIYKSLYDGHMAWTRPVNMFLSKVPEGRESENPTGQIYRFEEVE